ncbi:MAG: DNA polymerase III subunit beta [Ignavibacteriae bacterium]|nr:MAG: DNA polymerase III subunit beta [Ignavibacteriota bacterium]
MKTRFNEISKTLKRNLPKLKEEYKINTLEVFGSFVRSEQEEDSDLDLLITFTENPGLLKYIKLENFLSDLLGIKVDLVMKDSLKPRLNHNILEEAVLL